MFELFKTNKKPKRYSISVEMFGNGKERVKRVFSPLVRSKGRAMEYVMLVAERRGYSGIKILT